MDFDIIVVGGGHAGVEACMAAAHMGMHTLLCTLNIKMISNMPCNTDIGGSAKGVVVREIDALGGMMGIAADHQYIQMKMLNTAKGPGVQCLRAQEDKKLYPAYMQSLLSATENLTLKECEVIALLYDNQKVFGVVTGEGEKITAKAVVITTGTYMEGRIISGLDIYPGGPDGEKPSLGLSKCLQKMGIEIFRLKTGTPPRIAKDSIDFSKAVPQYGTEGNLAFSFATKTFIPLKDQLPCYLIYTSPLTLKIVRDNIKLSGLYNGTITSVGPRYCPAFESKVVRFADKPRHQLFLEPENFDSNSIYLQGFSTAMPHEIQEQMVHSLPGLEHAVLLKYSYEIEYDAIRPLQFDSSLRVKRYQGLYGAGQICGTSGYEEAAGLGLMAGINAVLWIKGEPPFVLRRNEAYIGVMIDDLVTKGTEEPYRLLSSRAEYRLLLRHDNADLRLTDYGHRFGLISDQRFAEFAHKYDEINRAIDIMGKTNILDKKSLNVYFVSNGYAETSDGLKAIDVLKRPQLHFRDLAKIIPELASFGFDDASIMALETKVKYEGYIAAEIKDAASFSKLEDLKLPTSVDYMKIDGLAIEARQKLNAVKPLTIGQASRISGVNPADVAVLLLCLKREKLL